MLANNRHSIDTGALNFQVKIIKPPKSRSIFIPFTFGYIFSNYTGTRIK